MIVASSKVAVGLYFDDEKPDLEFLAHYGIKGMKWGIRRKRNRTRTTKPSIPKEISERRLKQFENAIKVVSIASDLHELIDSTSPEIKRYKKLGETTVEAFGEIGINQLIRRSSKDKRIKDAVTNIVDTIRS